MHVLGLDPSLTGFGWAIHNTDGLGRERCIDRGLFETSPEMQEVQRYLFLKRSLADLLHFYPQVSRVGLESPYTGDTYSEGMYALFICVQEILYLSRRDTVFLGVSQIKAHALRFLDRPSSWKMGKSDSVEAVRLDTGGSGRWNHNEADAYLAARMGARFWCFYDGTLSAEDLTEYERHAFAREHTFTRGKKKGVTERDGIIHRENERFYLWSNRGDDGNEEKDN